MTFRIKLLILFFFFFSAISCIFPVVYAQNPYATVSIDKESVLLGETFMSTITVFYPDDYVLEKPLPVPTLPGLILLDSVHQSRIPDNAGVHDVFTIQCAVFSLGTHTLSVSDIQLAKNEEGSRVTVSTVSATVEVKSVLPLVIEKTDIADIKGIVKATSLAYFRFPLFLIALMGGIALFGFKWYERKSGKEDELDFVGDLTVHEQAYARLEKLQNSDLLKDGMLKEFYSQLAMILRSYIAVRFAITVEEKTSYEILKLIQSFSIKEEAFVNCKYALNECDMVKFAKFRPTVENIKQCFLAVKHFIDKTKNENNEL